jgi:hypothetical protein
LLWGCALFAIDLHARPAGRRAIRVKEGTSLAVGEPVHIRLAPDSIRYRSVAIRLEAATPAKLTIRLCAAEADCLDRSISIERADVVAFPVPGGGAEGMLALTATHLSGGPVSLRADSATPAVEVVQGYSWRLPARRAREVYELMAGGDWFVAALAAGSMALAAAFVVCCMLGFRTCRGSASAGSQAQSHGPGP